MFMVHDTPLHRRSEARNARSVLRVIAGGTQTARFTNLLPKPSFS
jgi:hypothetical protein